MHPTKKADVNGSDLTWTDMIPAFCTTISEVAKISVKWNLKLFLRVFSLAAILKVATPNRRQPWYCLNSVHVHTGGFSASFIRLAEGTNTTGNN